LRRTAAKLGKENIQGDRVLGAEAATTMQKEQEPLGRRAVRTGREAAGNWKTHVPKKLGLASGEKESLRRKENSP